MNRIPALIAATMLMLPVSALAQFGFFSSGNSMEEDNPIAVSQTVALMPVSVAPADPEHLRIAEFVNGELRLQLAMINGVHLLPAAATVEFANTTLLPHELGNALGAATLVRVGARPGLQGAIISITVRDATSGRVRIWSSGTGRVNGVPAVIDRIQHAVADVKETVEYWGNADRQLYREAMVAQVQPIFLDETRSDQERMHALNVLAPPRFGIGFADHYPDDGAVLSGVVAIAAANIASDSDVAAVRRSIWEIMAGVHDRQLVAPLLAAVADDPDAAVRSAAATALAVHVNEPGVRDALIEARTSDPSLDVRDSARSVLSSPRLKYDARKAAFVDTSLSTSDRWKSLLEVVLIHESNPVPVDDALLESIAEFAASAPETWTRVSAWQRFTSLAGSDAVGPLATALEFDADETVRERLVMDLSKYGANPAVASIIDKACVNDPSQLVRYAAQRALGGACGDSAAALTRNVPGEW